MNKKLRLGLLLASTFITSSAMANPADDAKFIKEINFIKNTPFQSDILALVNGLYGAKANNWDQIVVLYNRSTQVQKDQINSDWQELDKIFKEINIAEVNTLLGTNITSINDLIEGKVVLTELQKKKANGVLSKAAFDNSNRHQHDPEPEEELGIAMVKNLAIQKEIFAANPKLKSILVNMKSATDAERQELFNSSEFLALINSPEQQEVLKFTAKEIEEEAKHKKELGNSNEEIMKYINQEVGDLKYILANPDKGSDALTPIQKQDSAATDSLLISAAQVDLVKT